LLLCLNAAVCAVLGSAVFLAVRSRRVSIWVRRVLERVVRDAELHSPPSRAVAKAYVLCVMGRLTQTLQYGIVVLAVGGGFGATSAFTAHGINLLGASAGDFLPGQLGAVDGAYSTFASLFPWSDPQARALSIVMMMRCTVIALALVGLVVTSFGSLNAGEVGGEKGSTL
jgi:hypothetical protein